MVMREAGRRKWKERMEGEEGVYLLVYSGETRKWGIRLPAMGEIVKIDCCC
jgi:hypothetical protein